MKQKTTYALSPERIARLLAVGLECTDGTDSLNDSRTLAKALQDMLESKVPFDPAKSDSLPAVLRRPCDEILAAAGHTMSDLLLDSKTDLAVIKALKDYGRGLSRRRGPEAKRAMATVIYYAAIGSALVFHQDRITQHSNAKLQEAPADLKEKQWIPSDLKDVFKKAQAACQERKG